MRCTHDPFGWCPPLLSAILRLPANFFFQCIIRGNAFKGFFCQKKPQVASSVFRPIVEKPTELLSFFVFLFAKRLDFLIQITAAGNQRRENRFVSGRLKIREKRLAFRDFFMRFSTSAKTLFGEPLAITFPFAPTSTVKGIPPGMLTPGIEAC